MTRIISGRLRGKIIVAPAKLDIRPTTDFAKEGLFNILRNRYDWDQLQVLDLFAGMGNLSYELASRGVTQITAVDIQKACVRFIEKTAQELDFPIRVVHSEAIEFLRRAYQDYDLILADPPYDYEDYASMVDTIFLQKLLRDEDALLVVEHALDRDLSELPHFQETRKYGKVRFSFFGLAPKN